MVIKDAEVSEVRGGANGNKRKYGKFNAGFSTTFCLFLNFIFLLGYAFSKAVTLVDRMSTEADNSCIDFTR